MSGEFAGANEAGVDDRNPHLPPLTRARVKVTEFFKHDGHNGRSYILKFEVLECTDPTRVGIEHSLAFGGMVGSRRKLQLQKIRAMTAACMKVDGAAPYPFGDGPEAVNPETGRTFTWEDCMENGLRDAQPLRGCVIDIETSEEKIGQTSKKPYTVPTFSAVV